MSTLLIPMIYHPSSVLILDDSEAFIHALSLRLPDSVPYCLSTSPTKAISLLQDNHRTHTLTPPSMVSESCDQMDHRSHAATLSIDYAKLSDALNNPTRFNLVSCVIVDYTMPEMDGLNFLSHIHELPLKKIMLTGTADETMALKAHNQDQVDAFYLKNNTMVFNELIEQLSTLQHTYFVSYSEKFMALLKDPEPIFCNPAFAKKFQQYLTQYHIAEYYVRDRSGSLLLLSASGEAYKMNIFTKADLDEFTLMAGDAGLNKSMIEALSARIKIPKDLQQWLHSPTGMPPKECTNLNLVPGAEGYYYTWEAWGNLSNTLPDFLSFDYFMGNLWPDY